MRLQSAIFDMDGTLLDSMGMWRSLGRDLLLRHGVQPPADLDERLQYRNMMEGLALCKEIGNLPGTTEELLAEIWDHVVDFYHNRVQPKPGVVKFLSLLKMEGVWMYIATATDRPLVEAALRCAGIDGYFRGIVTTQEAGQGKRDGPAVYERALRRLRSGKKDTVVFEDVLHAVQTAKAAGFRVAAVYDPYEENQEALRRLADYYIQSFEEMFSSEVLE